MNFAVVSYLEENDYLGVVPTNWITPSGHACFNPRVVTDFARNKLIFTRQEPGIGWDEFKIKILRKFETYDTAKSYLRDAEKTTSTGTDCKERPIRVSKRRRKKRKIVLPGESSSSEEDMHINKKFINTPDCSPPLSSSTAAMFTQSSTANTHCTKETLHKLTNSNVQALPKLKHCTVQISPTIINHTAQTPYTPTNHTIQTPSTPTNHTVQTPSTPTNHTVQTPSTPTNHTVQTPSTPTNHTVQTPSTPTNHTVQTPSTPTNHTVQTTSTPTNNTAQTPSTPTNHTVQTPSTRTNHTIQTPSTPTNNMVHTPTTPINHNIQTSSTLTNHNIQPSSTLTNHTVQTPPTLTNRTIQNPPTLTNHSVQTPSTPPNLTILTPPILINHTIQNPPTLTNHSVQPPSSPTNHTILTPPTLTNHTVQNPPLLTTHAVQNLTTLKKPSTLPSESPIITDINQTTHEPKLEGLLHPVSQSPFGDASLPPSEPVYVNINSGSLEEMSLLSPSLSSPGSSSNTSIKSEILTVRRNQEMMWVVLGEFSQKLDSILAALARIESRIDGNQAQVPQHNGWLMDNSLLLVNLPLNKTDFPEFEEKLLDPAFRQRIVGILSDLSGSTVKSLAATFMRRLITDDLAEEYSLTGKRLNCAVKKAFDKTRTFMLVCQVCYRKYAGCEEREVREAVSDWLMQAKFRRLRREKRVASTNDLRDQLNTFTDLNM